MGIALAGAQDDAGRRRKKYVAAAPQIRPSMADGRRGVGGTGTWPLVWRPGDWQAEPWSECLAFLRGDYSRPGFRRRLRSSGMLARAFRPVSTRDSSLLNCARRRQTE